MLTFIFGLLGALLLFKLTEFSIRGAFYLFQLISIIPKDIKLEDIGGNEIFSYGAICLIALFVACLILTIIRGSGIIDFDFPWEYQPKKGKMNEITK